MLRLLAFATLFMVAVCLAIGVSIALADDTVVPATSHGRTIEAIDPDHRVTDDSLAAAEEDVHEFDFVATSGAGPALLEI